MSYPSWREVYSKEIEIDGEKYLQYYTLRFCPVCGKYTTHYYRIKIPNSVSWSMTINLNAVEWQCIECENRIDINELVGDL